MQLNTCVIALGFLVLGCFTSLGAAQNHFLVIKEIKCLQQNEGGDGDEMSIAFFADDVYQRKVQWDHAKKGNIYVYGHKFGFDNSFKITMIERDVGNLWDRDDRIGELVIDNEKTLAEGKGTIAGDDAIYEVYWDVVTP